MPTPGPDAQQLFDENQGLVSWVISKHYPRACYGAEREDYVQMGLTGLWSAAQTYNPEKGKFGTHAYWRIRGAIATGLRSYGHHHTAALRGRWNHPLFGALERPGFRGGAEDIGHRAATTHQATVDVCLERELVPELHRVISTLPEQQRRTMELIASGMTQAAVGVALGLTRGRINQIYLKAKAALSRHSGLAEMMLVL